MVIVTIGGEGGSGKSTIGRMLSERLGIPFFDMGDIRRKYALENGMTLIELNAVAEKDPFSDKLVDEFMAKLPDEHESFIVVGRTGFFILPQSIKIYIKVDPHIAADRIIRSGRASETFKTKEDAVTALVRRQERDRLRYIKLYNKDIIDFSQYDLILDSSHHPPEEMLAQVLVLLKARGVAVPDVPSA